MRKYRLLLVIISVTAAVLVAGCQKQVKEERGEITPLGEIKTNDEEKEAVAAQELDALRQEAEEKKSSVVVNPTEKETAESLEYVPREELAGNKLPYFLKEIKIVNENSSNEYIAAKVDPVKLRVYEINWINDTAGNVIELLDAENKDTIEGIAAMFVSKDASDEDKINSIIRAVTACSMGAGAIDKIDCRDNKLIAIDINGKKIEHDMSTGTKLFDGKDTMPDEEEYTRLAQLITAKYDIVLSKEKERLSAMSEEEQELEAEELARLKEAIEAAQSISAVPAMPEGVPFTDKTGNTAFYTKQEWEYLRNIWAYTGHPDDLVKEHTNAELRQLLNQR